MPSYSTDERVVLMSIILYDIPSTSPGYSVSPMTWRIRYCLGIKGIPDKTEWVEYPDIQPLYKKLGIDRTSTRSDGSPFCTLPVIYDPSTKKYIHDSFEIAQYLEEQYPNTTSVFPNNTTALHLAFTDGLWGIIPPMRTLLSWNHFASLNPVSAAYYRNAMEPIVGKKMEELILAGREDAELDNLKEVSAKFDVYYAKNGDTGPFLMGEVPSWSDVAVASFLALLKVAWGDDSEKWKDAMSYPDGRWAVFMENMRKYE